MDALVRWHAVAKSRDSQGLAALIDADAIFESPVVHTAQRGHAMVCRYLASAMQILGGPAFRYTGEWVSATGAVLEFETEIDGIAINGVDIIHFTPDGERIARFKVMIRPLKAIELVYRLMGEALSRGGPSGLTARG